MDGLDDGASSCPHACVVCPWSGAPGTVSVDATALQEIVNNNEKSKPLARGQTAEMRAQDEAIKAMKEASGMYSPPPPRFGKWLNLGGGRGAGRRMLTV